MRAVGRVDMRNELLDEDVLAHPIFLLRVVVPAHVTPVRENVNHGSDLFAFNGSENERGQRDALLFRSGTSAMEAIDDREFPVPVFWRIVLLGQVEVITDLDSHAWTFERRVPEIGRESLERPLLGWIVPRENRFSLEAFGFFELSEAPDRERVEESEQVEKKEFHTLEVVRPDGR